MTIEKKNLDLEVKQLNEDGSFEGLLSVYDVVDEYNDVVERGAFTKTLQENAGKVPLLWQHNPEHPIGSLDLADGESGLEAKGKILLSDDVPQGKTAYALLKAGIVRGMSIGYRTIKKKQEDSIRRLKEIKLFEGSLVTIPANRFALVSSVKALADAKDFASELEMIQLMDAYYQQMSALRGAMYKALHDQKMTSQQKTDAAAEIIDQFRASFMQFVPRYLDMMDEMQGMYMMSAEALEKKLTDMPDPVREKLNEYCKSLLEHSGTQRAAGAAREAKSSTSRETPSTRDLLASLVTVIKSS